MNIQPHPTVTDPTCDIRLQPGAARVLEAATAGHFAGRLPYRLQLQAERLALVAGFDELVCLDALHFTPFDYQIKAAQTALRRFRGRGLLCDEVGLGKTIEAGLVLQEYLLRQMVNRVLIITPPALVEQWREELVSKFGLTDFVANYDPQFRELGPQAWAAFPRVQVITQPKILLPARIANRTATVERTVVWDPLLHRIEPLACDVCGWAATHLTHCTGGHLAHEEECLLPEQCVDCKRIYCRLCADLMGRCVVCDRPVCEHSLNRCQTCGRGTCREHVGLCHADDGQPVQWAPPEPPEPPPPPPPVEKVEEQSPSPPPPPPDKEKKASRPLMPLAEPAVP